MAARFFLCRDPLRAHSHLEFAHDDHQPALRYRRHKHDRSWRLRQRQKEYNQQSMLVPINTNCEAQKAKRREFAHSASLVSGPDYCPDSLPFCLFLSSNTIAEALGKAVNTTTGIYHF